jgi:serine/threonine protein kinase
VHRDVKLENILISSIEDRSEYDIRIADFGLAVLTPDDDRVTGKCGSPGYVAPEVFKGTHYSYKVDVFSLGSVFYQLLTGQYLFDGNTAKAIIKKNIECDLSHTYRQTKHISTQCRDLMMWMLEADPEDRPTAKQALRHHWFKCDKQVIKDLLSYNEVICTGNLER